jgi:hypothetical protein
MLKVVYTFLSGWAEERLSGGAEELRVWGNERKKERKNEFLNSWLIDWLIEWVFCEFVSECLWRCVVLWCDVPGLNLPKLAYTDKMNEWIHSWMIVNKSIKICPTKLILYVQKANKSSTLKVYQNLWQFVILLENHDIMHCHKIW